jgi:hypothetical protein
MRNIFILLALLAVSLSSVPGAFAQMCPGGKTVEVYRQSSLRGKKVLVALVYTEALEDGTTFYEHWCELPKFKPLAQASKAVLSFNQKSTFASFADFQAKCDSIAGASMKVHSIDDASGEGKE